MSIPSGLHRCAQCGELRGRVLANGSAPPATTFVSCLCAGVVCRYCRKRAIHKPVSSYYDEAAGAIRYVPWSGRLQPCPDCR